ncbi:MAG TPA: hypothetical protein PKE69_00150 [Pyrinomonadaceae bacterium]|nr:hypothetical protein [Pyrinomonadaceae bacterium]
MILIRDRTIEEISLKKTLEWKHEFAGLLRIDCKEQTGLMSYENLLNLVTEGIEAALKLKINGKTEVYRFIKIRFLAPNQIRQGFAGIDILKVLLNTENSDKDRLNFIEENLLVK